MSTSRLRHPRWRRASLGLTTALFALAVLNVGSHQAARAQVPGGPPTVGSFTPGGTLGGPRFGHSSVPLANGDVLIYGAAPVAEIYTPASGKTEFLTTPARDIVLFATLTTLNDGRVLVAGGFSVDPVTDTGTPIASAMLFDPRAHTWTPVGPMTVARAFHTATLLQDGRVLVIGGIDSVEGATPSPASLRTSEIFDPATRRFAKSAAIPSDTVGHTATLLADGKVLVSSDVAYLYEPTAGTFALVGSVPTERLGGAAVRLEDGSVLLVGGENENGVGTPTAERFQPSTGRFTPAGRLAQERTFLSASLLPGGQVLVIGGGNPQTGDPLATTEVWDPSAGSFSPGPSMAAARAYHTATTLADGRVVVTGGFAADSAIASIELFTPAGAGKPYAGGAPAARSQGLLVTTRTATADDLVKAATADGCAPRVVATLQSGTWRIFIPGAPSVVNAVFPASLPASTPLFVGCS